MKEVAQAPVNQQDAIAGEVKAQADAISNTFKTSGAIGPLGLEVLAAEVGKSANKSGRPSLAAFLALMLAIASVKPSYAVQNRLAAIANKNVNPDYVNAKGERIQVASTKAKGEFGAASCAYRFKQPVAWTIAIGE